MLTEVTGAARQVLRAERCSVWQRDAAGADLVLKVASDIHDVRIAVGTGLVGACARDREIINVPDCYADPRFDSQVDRNSGFHTRCSLTLPLIDHRDGLVGVMQLPIASTVCSAARTSRWPPRSPRSARWPCSACRRSRRWSRASACAMGSRWHARCR